MIKHIVIWKLKNHDHRSEDTAAIKDALEALAGRIPGLRRIEVGGDIGYDAQADDVVLYSEFDDRAALDRYQSHPLHLEARAVVAARVSGRHTVDYER